MSRLMHRATCLCLWKLSGMIDVGNPQLSMHSIREVGGTDDVKHGIDLLKASNIRIGL